MTEENTSLGFTSIIDDIPYFFTRNYRRRSFLKSKLYAKYKEHIAIKPEDKSKLIFPQNTIKEEYRVVKLFSEISNTQDINKKILKKYNLNLAELMIEERVTDFLDNIAEIYDTKHNGIILKNTKNYCVNFTNFFSLQKNFPYLYIHMQK